jgi:V/A-type H+-transporting ATPase subunit K
MNEEEAKMEIGLIAIGAGLAIGLAALGTALAQARIGAAAIGAILEKPESLGTVLILLVIPETLVIFGFTIAILIMYTLK